MWIQSGSFAGRVVAPVSGGKISFVNTATNQRMEVAGATIKPLPPGVNDRCVVIAGDAKNTQAKIVSIQPGENEASVVAICEDASGEMAMNPLNDLVKFTAN